MKPKIFCTILVALFLISMAISWGCANKSVDPKAEETLKAKKEYPPAPPEGHLLAKAATKVTIENGPASPSRKVLSQTPQQRPCWALAEGVGCPLDKPGYLAFVGMSSGAATDDGAVLNAYQDAVERLSKHCMKVIGDNSPETREYIRSRAYDAAGINDKSFRLNEGQWIQKWKEEYKTYMRVYYRAFVMLVIAENQIGQLTP